MVVGKSGDWGCSKVKERGNMCFREGAHDLGWNEDILIYFNIQFVIKLVHIEGHK